MGKNPGIIGEISRIWIRMRGVLAYEDNVDGEHRRPDQEDGYQGVVEV
jgi:hypothetical protein